MAIPKSFKMDEGRTNDYALQLHKNVYGQKQAGQVWNKYLMDKLVKRVGFLQSKVDKRVFYRGTNNVHIVHQQFNIGWTGQKGDRSDHQRDEAGKTQYHHRRGPPRLPCGEHKTKSGRYNRVGPRGRDNKHDISYVGQP